MNEYEQRLKTYITNNDIAAEHLSFNQSCHSVAEAAEVVGASAEEFVKNICMIDSSNNLIVAIVKGEDRASTSQVAKHLKVDNARLAKPDEILERTGYPCGGTPSFGYKAKFLVDPRVLEREFVFTGGGSQTSLVKVSTKALLQANQGEVAKLRR